MVLARYGEFRLGLAAVDPAAREVSWPGGSRSIEPRAMQVLVALAAAGGAVVTRDELIAACWNGANVTDDAVSRIIAQLRRLAQEIGPGAFAVDTISKVGYRLVGAEPAGAEAAVPATAARSAAGTKHRGPILLAASLLILVLAAAAAWWRAASTADLPLSVAVEGFSSLDGVSRATVQAMNEELRTALRASGVEIDDRASTLLAAGAARRVGHDLRVTTRLDDRATGKVLWSDVQEVPQGDPGALTGAMATLGFKLRCGLDAARSRAPRLSAPQIGLYFDYCDNGVVGDGALKSLVALRALTRSEPDFAPAWFAIGSVAGGILFHREDPAVRAEGLEAVRRGSAIAPYKGDGLFRRAVLLPASQAIERENLLRRALPLDTIHCRCAGDFLGDFLLQSGRFREALAVYRGAEADKIGNETGSPLPLWRLGIASELSGDRSSANALFAKLDADFGPSPRRLWQRALWRGELTSPALRASAWRPDGLLPPVWEEVMGALTAGDKAARLRAAAKLRAVSPEAQVAEVPGLLVQLGDIDGALAALEASRRVQGPFAAPGRYPGWAQPLVWDPTLRPLWRDPRFAAFLKRAGFIDYWRRTRSRPDLCAEPIPAAFCGII